MTYIDDDDDHVDRPIDIQHVFKMIDKARTNDDGTKVMNPTFTSYCLDETYEYCVCGHKIKYNHTATCVETGKSFIVGSDCIETVCKEMSYKLFRKCQICKEPASSKSSNLCTTCKKMVTSCDKNVGEGKYSTLPYRAVPQDYKDFIRKSTYLGKELSKLRDWILYTIKHPRILTYRYNLEE